MVMVMPAELEAIKVAMAAVAELEAWLRSPLR
eukprot:COSAG02_NODE_1545_length_11996_cov_6.889636_14_plen_32_part_00